MALYNFPRFDSEANMVGYNQFFFIPKDELVENPIVWQGSVVGDLSIVDTWYKGYSVFTELNLNDGNDKSAPGNRWSVSLSGKMPVWKPETQYLLEQLCAVELVCLVMDNNNRLRLLGDKNSAMRLSYTLEGSGYQITIYGELQAPAPYYAGNVPNFITVNTDDTTMRSDGSILGPTYVWARYKIEMDATSGKGDAGSAYLSLEIPAKSMLMDYTIVGENLVSATNAANIAIYLEEQVGNTDVFEMLPSTVITDIVGPLGKSTVAPLTVQNAAVKVRVDYSTEDITGGTLWVYAFFHLL